MKANELMIGDWVAIEYYATGVAIDGVIKAEKKARPCKVVQIENDMVTLNRLDGKVRDYLVTDLIPIPLTAEILEKNGFVENDGSTSWKFETNRETLVTIYGVSEYHLSINIEDTHGCGKGFRWLLYDYTIFYVHQLQQILRVFRVDKTIEL